MRVNEVRTLVRQHHREQGGEMPLSRLRELRLTRGWSQQELAAEAHVSRRTIARLEGGVAARVSASVLIRVAAVFDEPLATLFPELGLPAPSARRKKVS